METAWNRVFPAAFMQDFMILKNDVAKTEKHHVSWIYDAFFVRRKNEGIRESGQNTGVLVFD